MEIHHSLRTQLKLSKGKESRHLKTKVNKLSNHCFLQQMMVNNLTN